MIPHSEERANAPRVAIVGAGVSGIAVARALRNADIEFTIFEKASEAGGTWRDNVYPGLKCDVPLLSYCYSFAPGTRGWDKLLAPGAEIQRQLLGILDREGLRETIRFDSHIVECRWNVDHWQLKTQSGQEHRFEVVVHATGFLHKPRFPDIDGLDSFDGPVIHTARWDASVELEGKRVGVVGSGSTGVQVVTALSEEVAHLISFQRTPQWVLQLNDVTLPKPLQALLRRPKSAEFIRRKFWEFNGKFVGTAALKGGWRRKLMNKAMADHLATVKDPELRARLTPKDPPLCKRPVMSGNYYEAVQRPNVEVVVGGIEHVDAGGVVTDDGTLHELDVLVLATGYEAHAYMRPMQVVGEEGVTLDELWKDGVFSYRSIGLPGFPNLFMIMGPFTSTSHIGVQEQAEAQAGYIVKMVRHLSRADTISLTPSHEATDAWVAELAEVLPTTIWTQCSSYFNEGGRDNLPVQYGWSRKHYFKMLEEPDLSEYTVRMAGDTEPALAVR